MMSRFLGALTATLLCTGAALAADGATSNAVPQFAFMDGGWQAAGADFLQPPSGPGPVRDVPGHEHGGNNTGVQPSFRMADLSNPILQPWVRDALKKVNDRIAAGGGGFTPQVSCIPLGVPAYLLHPAQPVYFIQTPKEVVLIWPPNHEVRHIYLTDKHSVNLKPAWFGESIGHYENGDTLVVDTIGLSTRNSYIDNFRTPHTEKEHVVERYKMTADGKMLEASVTVEDPDTFNAPLHMLKRWRRADNPTLETVCAENNGDHFSKNLFPIPQADKPDF
jgi:hypothetical protein